MDPVELKAKQVAENMGHLRQRECGVACKCHLVHPKSLPKVTQVWQSQHSNSGQSDSKIVLFFSDIKMPYTAEILSKLGGEAVVF